MLSFTWELENSNGNSEPVMISLECDNYAAVGRSEGVSRPLSFHERKTSLHVSPLYLSPCFTPTVKVTRYLWPYSLSRFFTLTPIQFQALCGSSAFSFRITLPSSLPTLCSPSVHFGVCIVQVESITCSPSAPTSPQPLKLNDIVKSSHYETLPAFP